MVKRGLIILGLLLGLFAGAGVAPVHAESGSDYARAVAPDVPAAVTFLRDTMGCDVLDTSRTRALLECAQGTVVEIIQGIRPTGGQPPLRLRADHADATLAWLRQRHVPLADGQGDGSVGVDGLLHVDLDTPWGQTLELVGHVAPLPHGNPLAAD